MKASKIVQRVKVLPLNLTIAESDQEHPQLLYVGGRKEPVFASCTLTSMCAMAHALPSKINEMLKKTKKKKEREKKAKASFELKF